MIIFEDLWSGLIIASILTSLIVVLTLIGRRRIFQKLYVVNHPLIDFIRVKKRMNTSRILLEALFITVSAMLIIAYMNPYYTYRETISGVEKGVGELSFRVKPAVILVIDVSGSMSGYKIETAKQALREFIREINGTLDIGLIAFDGRITATVAPTSRYDILYNVINRLEAGGGTMYSYPLKLAYVWLKPYREFNINASIVFASDGLPADRNEALKIVEKYAGDKITIYGVFIGESTRGYELIREMAEETGGEAYQADEISKLVGIYEKIASTIKNATLGNITINLHYEKTVTRRISISNYVLLATIPLITLLYYYTYRLYRILF